MTKEQEEAIKYFEDKIRDVKPEYIEIYVAGKKYRSEVIPLKMRFDQEDAKKMKTVLNMLKEKELEIEKYKKIINLMTEHIVSSAIVDDTVCAIKCDCETYIEEDCTHEKMINCTKQHFERKAKYGR